MYVTHNCWRQRHQPVCRGGCPIADGLFLHKRLRPQQPHAAKKTQKDQDAQHTDKARVKISKTHASMMVRDSRAQPCNCRACPRLLALLCATDSVNHLTVRLGCLSADPNQGCATHLGVSASMGMFRNTAASGASAQSGRLRVVGRARLRVTPSCGDRHTAHSNSNAGSLGLMLL